MYIVLAVASLSTFCDAYSSYVSCGTPMSSAGHGYSTTPGSATIRLARGGSSLACGSQINSGETLSTVTSGDHGKMHLVQSLSLLMIHNIWILQQQATHSLKS